MHILKYLHHLKNELRCDLEKEIVLQQPSGGEGRGTAIITPQHTSRLATLWNISINTSVFTIYGALPALWSHYTVHKRFYYIMKCYFSVFNKYFVENIEQNQTCYKHYFFSLFSVQLVIMSFSFCFVNFQQYILIL